MDLAVIKSGVAGSWSNVNAQCTPAPLCGPLAFCSNNLTYDSIQTLLRLVLMNLKWSAFHCSKQKMKVR